MFDGRWNLSVVRPGREWTLGRFETVTNRPARIWNRTEQRQEPLRSFTCRPFDNDVTTLAGTLLDLFHPEIADSCLVKPTMTNPAMRLGLLGCLILAVPLATWWALPFLPSWGTLPEPYFGGSIFPASRLPMQRIDIGPPPGLRPWIGNIQIADLDQDGRNDIIACDVGKNRVLCYRQLSGGEWDEEVLGEDLLAPAHATVVDLDQDGDRDVVVAVLGNIWPDDGVIGRIVWLERTPDGYERHLLLDDVRRVADVQPADFDADGDIDLAVAVFGYARGEVLWLENLGSQQFRDHTLLVAPGTIHVPVADYDGDGDMDIAAVVTQDEEEVWGFENLGDGEFRPRRLFFTVNYDLGGAGLVQTDLDGDGDADLLLPVGDNLEDLYSYPQPYHGCLWLENKGAWRFEVRRIATFGGTYAAAVGDLDRDGDRDVVLVSMFNEWSRPGTASIVWLENDGEQNFTTWQIDDRPAHLITVACGDIDGDGRDDIVAGGLPLEGPAGRRHSRIVAWMNRAGENP